MTLAEYRKMQGYTQAQLAQKVNVSLSSIALYETHKRKPRYKTLKKISQALCVSISDLVELFEE